jgi:hypothetical protein
MNRVAVLPIAFSLGAARAFGRTFGGRAHATLCLGDANRIKVERNAEEQTGTSL